MDYITYTARLEYLLELIEKGQCYSPTIIAQKFNCTERTVRNMINRLREKGYVIIYCKSNKKYMIEK